jgi:hypothetical protein
MQEIKELIIILKDKKSIKYILYVRAHSQLKGTLRFRLFTPHPHLTEDPPMLNSIIFWAKKEKGEKTLTTLPSF